MNAPQEPLSWKIDATDVSRVLLPVPTSPWIHRTLWAFLSSTHSVIAEIKFVWVPGRHSTRFGLDASVPVGCNLHKLRDITAAICKGFTWAWRLRVVIYDDQDKLTFSQSIWIVVVGLVSEDGVNWCSVSCVKIEWSVDPWWKLGNRSRLQSHVHNSLLYILDYTMIQLVSRLRG